METKKIEEIVNIFEKSDVAKMELKVGELKIKLEKSVAPSAEMVPVQNVVYTKESSVNSMVKELKEPQADNTANVQEEAPKSYIKSPIVGTFYQASAVGAEPYVKVGDRVNVGDVVCIVEAMKVMNEIKSDKAGVIKEVLAKDGSMVEYDAPLFVIGD